MRARAQLRSHPLHPMLVAFPIGLWIGSFAFDVAALAQGDPSLAAAGFYAVIGGCAGAVLAAIAGATDLFGVVPSRSSAKQRGYIHALLNVAALVLFIIVAARRGGAAAMPDGFSLLLSAIGVILILCSGWLGGTLVYRNQIGVDHRYANAGKWRERKLAGWDQPVCNQSELADGQMVLAEVKGLTVVIGRCPEGMFAFSNHCTHSGGPLSDGALVGCTVQCPWHGSQFDIRTGHVVAGPARSNIETYPVEVRGGEVFVMPNRARPEKKEAA
ncbi:MAG TPA: DUF2231 domain-containing protein [Terriglobales bacterium]|jgi:nitrite reductase/ring-hydroxylating ferredoxin subunit/uncharacterized membrane protein|nr:DUF2231 domain-containing protein [Terriglobales bacterium]